MRWRFMDHDPGRLTPDDRGFAYGDGLFETIAVRDGSARLLDRHLARLYLGGRRLGLELPSEEALVAFIEEALASRPRDPHRAVLKLVVTRGDGPRGYRIAETAPRIILGLAPAAPVNADYYRRGIVAKWCRTRLGRNTALAGLKHLDRLEQVLARAEWSDDDIAEGLMLDSAGRLVCGTMSNLFLVGAETLITPAMTHAGVAGIMRGAVLEVAQALGLRVEVREVEPLEVATMDELYLTNSQYVLWPVRRLGSKPFEVGDVTRAIMDGLRARGISEWHD